MKATRSILKGASKAAIVLFIGAAISSCNKGTSCPAYAGAKKYKRHASVMPVEKVVHHSDFKA